MGNVKAWFGTDGGIAAIISSIDRATVRTSFIGSNAHFFAV